MKPLAKPLILMILMTFICSFAPTAAADPRPGSSAEDKAMSASEIVDYDYDGPIELNEETFLAIKNYFKKLNTGKLKKVFTRAFYEMGAWEPYLKEIFRQEGVPEQYIYLAIVESYWRTCDRSCAGAVGPYQFMPKTARSHDLRMDDYIDERKDPFKSARAAARYLHELFLETGDWNLTFSRYNGSFVDDYLKKAGGGGSYTDYLPYMAGRINDIRTEIDKREIFIHVVEEGETLSGIAVRYGVEFRKFCELNDRKPGNKKDMIIRPKDELILPANKKVRKSFFSQAVRGLKENIAFAAKVRAIIELIESGFVSKQKAKIVFRTITVRKKNVSLKSLTTRYHVPLERLKYLNPAIRSGHINIPIGYEVRI